MYYLFVLFFYFLVFSSCSTANKEKELVVARVGNSFLKANDDLLKKSFSRETSSLQIDRWVEEMVLYKAAIEKEYDKDSSIIEKRDLFFKNLIISSFLEQETAQNVIITKDNIREYYKKNKMEFKRTEDEIYVDHYKTKSIKNAKLVFSFLTTKKTKDEVNISSFFSSSDYIKKNRIDPVFDKALFNSRNDIIGPIEKDGFYHVFNIVEKYKKNSFIGLDLVSDKIYQRLYKKQELLAKKILIDSLKQKITIYKNPSYK